MAYELAAFLGERAPMDRLAERLGVALVELSQGVLLLPFSEQARVAAKAESPAAPGVEWPFGDIDAACAAALASEAGPGRVAYVEAEFFGGVGGQVSVGWVDGARTFGPLRSSDAINQAARFLGVVATGEDDEFDTLGLGRHRRTERW